MSITRKKIKKIMYILLICILFILCTICITNIVTEPSNMRDWSPDQAILPEVEFDPADNNIVTIRNVRNFNYSSTTAYEQSYYDKTFDLRNLKDVWYIVEPFSGIPGSAHTMLSFEFASTTSPATTLIPSNKTSFLERDFVTISVEIRKEKGESFHPIKGLFNQYEMMYVIADEHDAVKLRSNYRKDLVYMYPVGTKTDTEKKRALFVSMLKSAEELRHKPEFYNTITNTCTTNIVSHVNGVSHGRIPWIKLAILFPAQSDKLAYKLGLLDINPNHELSDASVLEKMRQSQRFLINERALSAATSNSNEFSIKIRDFDQGW